MGSTSKSAPCGPAALRPCGPVTHTDSRSGSQPDGGWASLSFVIVTPPCEQPTRRLGSRARGHFDRKNYCWAAPVNRRDPLCLLLLKLRDGMKAVPAATRTFSQSYIKCSQQAYFFPWRENQFQFRVYVQPGWFRTAEVVTDWALRRD